MSEILVRRAIVEDATAIARVHIQAWRETYTRLVEPGELDELSIEARAARWAKLTASDETRVWVAVVEETLVGWASTGSGRDAGAPRPLELEGLYVLADHHGSGAGQSLIEAAIGDSPAYLFVAAGNPRAQAFYRRNGFEADGRTDRHRLVRTHIEVVRMVR